MSKKLTVEVVQMFQVPSVELWRAITQARLMRQWFFENIPSFQREVGFETKFDVTSSNTVFTHQWKVLEVIPQQRLKIRWEYDGFPGTSTVTFEVTEKDSATRLSLVHEGIDSFPKHVPEFSPESCRQGWEYFIQNRLKAFLED